MNTATTEFRTPSTWFARFRAHCAHAWAIHVRTCELMAESHRRLF
ncbi:hypothetical protein [Paraburkholderia sp. BCC1886]|nr:hypothetical protein [Paraburkholderia sp. BCC1886]